jgi:hypothetical protein
MASIKPEVKEIIRSFINLLLKKRVTPILVEKINRCDPFSHADY